MKGILALALFLLALFATKASAYLLPVYIANPETGECKYYFAGDARHYNPPPNGTWYIVGLSESNWTECQEVCFMNTNRFWEGVLRVTKNNLTLEDIPLDLRIWTNLGCSCLAEGKHGCEAWCRLNGGVLNETNWTNSVKCICPEGEWVPYEGCKEARLSAEVREIPWAFIAFLAGLALGAVFRIRRKEEGIKTLQKSEKNASKGS